MTQLQTKSGEKVFEVLIRVAKAGIVKKDKNFIAIVNGEEMPGIVAKVEGHKLAELVPMIDPAALVGKDPTTLTQEELIALTTYLQELAAGKVVKEEVAEEKPAKKKKAKPAPVEEEEDEEEEDDFEDVEGDDEEEEDEEEKVAPPKGVKNYDQLRKLGTKKLWAIAKELNLDGINSRSKLDELSAALAEYFGFDLPGDEEEEDDAEIVNDSVEDVEDGEEEYDEEEDEEDESDEDEDEEDEDEDESDDEEEDDEEEDDEEDEDDEDALTEEDIDNLKTKQEIQAVMKKHGIKPPTGGKITIGKVKAHIKAQLFGE